jgi:hypothetical protein
MGIGAIIFLWAFVGLLLGGLPGSWFGGQVDREGVGFWLGYLLGPLGWIIVLLLPPGGRHCPECGGYAPGRVLCMHCGYRFEREGGQDGAAKAPPGNP